MKFETDCLYKITFLDHAIGDKGVVTCIVVGWVIEQDKEQVTLSYWIVETDDKELRDNNLEPVSIIKSTILKIRQIK